jgi:hypothetical protein
MPGYAGRVENTRCTQTAASKSADQEFGRETMSDLNCSSRHKHIIKGPGFIFGRAYSRARHNISLQCLCYFCILAVPSALNQTLPGFESR